MAKFERILSFFPAFYEARGQYKLLYQVVRLLAQPLEEADNHLLRIQRAHRLLVAEHVEDIIRLAAILNLTSFHFEDILANETIDYDQKLSLMRERVQHIARLHIKGLGTLWAVMQSAAIFLNATIVPERPGDQPIKHLDEDGYSHKAIIEFTHLPDRPRERIYLHENPFRHKKIDLAEKRAPNSWAIENESMTDAPARLVIQGIDDRTVFPSIYCAETEEGIFFNGIVPAGQTLVIDELSGATIDGHPVDDWLIYFRGAAFDISLVNGSTHFVHQEGSSATPFVGDPENVPIFPYRRRKPVPIARMGHSQWYFKVAEGIYNGLLYDFAVYATPRFSVGIYDGDFSFDACVYDYPASAITGMAWDERIPCAFKLLLPANVPQSQKEVNSAEMGGEDTQLNMPTTESNYVSRIGNIVHRFRAGGVRAFVDTASIAWILGESILRGSEVSEGEGATFHATYLRDQRADMRVTFNHKTRA